MNSIDKKYEASRKYKEYETKIIKMAGYLTDYYIDRAIESDDFSTLSSFLIDYFSGTAGKSFDVGYLVSKYKEFGLNKKIEDMAFNVDEWYKVKYEIDKPMDISDDDDFLKSMSDEEYIKFMIEKRKKS